MTRAAVTQVTTTAEPTPRGLHAVAPAHGAAERQADQYADTATSPTVPGDVHWSFADLPVHPAPRPEDPQLDVRLDGPGQVLGPDLPEVRIHTDASAADLTRRAGADAVTVGRHVAFAPGRFQPATVEGRRRIAHEVAHVAQSRRGPAVAHRQKGGAVAPVTTLGGLPEADRKRLQVITTTTIEAPSEARLKDELFDKGTRIHGPKNVDIAVDASVPQTLRAGIRNLAGDWSTGPDPTLKPNSTLTISLDLTPVGGTKGAYRFTFSRPPAAKGKKPAGRIIVERLGAPSPPRGTAKPRAAKPGAKAPPDPIETKMKAAAITQTGYDTPAEINALRQAISLVPASHLAAVRGLRFRRAPENVGANKKAAGHYFPADDKKHGVKAHTIVMYDKAFDPADVVAVQGGTAASYAATQIIHEIGHAVDLRRLQLANDAVDAAFKTGDPAEIKKARKTLAETRSRSGTRTVTRKGNIDEDVIGTSAKGSDFREAVKKDGKNVSKYGEKDWQESYAEAYAQFVSAPDQLKLIRPATHAYFEKNLPQGPAAP